MWHTLLHLVVGAVMIATGSGWTFYIYETSELNTVTGRTRAPTYTACVIATMGLVPLVVGLWLIATA